jgi:hypothetical protein
MTTTTAIAEPAAGREAAITTEDDATPLVRLIGRTLRDSARLGHASEELDRAIGVVAIRSHDTPQAATITLAGGPIEVAAGVLAEPDATVVVDLHDRFAAAAEATGDESLAAAVLLALRPPLPHWRAAAERFWEVTRAIPGIPEVLVVEVQNPDGAERAEFGSGETTYLMAGPSDVLAGVLSGVDDFLAALAAGLQIKGTLSQLSVMTAASWKVRFDV